MLYDRFRVLFPMYGAFSWLVESAVQEMVGIAEKDPERVGGLVRHAVEQRLIKLAEERGNDAAASSDPKQLDLFRA